jgi:hypothetical protein
VKRTDKDNKNKSEKHNGAQLASMNRLYGTFVCLECLDSIAAIGKGMATDRGRGPCF